MLTLKFDKFDKILRQRAKQQLPGQLFNPELIDSRPF